MELWRALRLHGSKERAGVNLPPSFLTAGAASARKIIPHAMAICQEENSKNFLEKFEKMG